MRPRDDARRAGSGGPWRSVLAWSVGGFLIFETVTGLVAWGLPGSLFAQLGVLAHVIVGVPFLVPLAWYVARHWWELRGYAFNHYKATGHATFVVLAACCLSGAVLTWQAAFGRRISWAWDAVHVVTTIALVVFAATHVGLLLLRERGRPAVSPVRRGSRRYATGSLATAGLGLVALVVATVAYQEPHLDDSFPADYVLPHGEERPFAPSLATTETGGALDSRRLAGSFGCGTEGCHEQVTEEWAVSAHRWSAMDPAFRTVQDVMATQNGPESTRYCGGCHDPISLFSGEKNVFAENLTSQAGFQEGVSCLTCHGIHETDLKGNAAYVVGAVPRHAFELHEGPLAKVASDFLIRALPRPHVDALGKTLFKTPEYCAACHKQFIDEEVNQVGWVQLQNQYDNWRKSRWNHPGDPTRTIECRECHMPLVDSRDPAAGDDADYNRSPDDGKHRSHRFLAANQLVPTLLDLEGAEEQVALTEKWLRGELDIPEIAHKWKSGPAVPIELQVPETAAPGEEIRARVTLTSNKVGHDFPTGPLDIIQAWVEIEVTNESGDVVFHSGRVDEDDFVEPGSFMFKAEAVDQYGNLIDRHNLWEMVGVRYRRSLFPGFADATEYAFDCPSLMTTTEPRQLEGEQVDLVVPEGVEGRLHVRARLRYRKIDQYLLNYLFGEETKLTSPVTDLSEDEAVIRVVPRT